MEFPPFTQIPNCWIFPRRLSYRIVSFQQVTVYAEKHMNVAICHTCGPFLTM
jgi:hypothetical protein